MGVFGWEPADSPSWAERQSELNTAASKREAARDKKAAELARKIQSESAACAAEVKKLNDAAQAETERLAVKLAAYEERALTPILKQCIDSGFAVDRATVADLCKFYQSCMAQSARLLPTYAGAPMMHYTGRLYWCIGLAMVGAPSELAKHHCFTVAPDPILYPHQIRDIAAGALDEGVNYKPTFALVDAMGDLSGPLGKLHDALMANRKVEVIHWLQSVVDVLERRLDKAPDASWNASERVRVQRLGHPGLVMREWREAHEIESAPARAEQAERSAIHSASYQLQQKVNNGLLTAGDARTALKNQFGSKAAGVHIQDPRIVDISAQGPIPEAKWRPDPVNGTRVDQNGTSWETRSLTDSPVPPDHLGA